MYIFDETIFFNMTHFFGWLNLFCIYQVMKKTDLVEKNLVGQVKGTSCTWLCVSGTLWKRTCSVYSSVYWTSYFLQTRWQKNKAIFICYINVTWDIYMYIILIKCSIKDQFLLLLLTWFCLGDRGEECLGDHQVPVLREPPLLPPNYKQCFPG